MEGRSWAARAAACCWDRTWEHCWGSQVTENAMGRGARRCQRVFPAAAGWEGAGEAELLLPITTRGIVATQHTGSRAAVPWGRGHTVPAREDTRSPKRTCWPRQGRCCYPARSRQAACSHLPLAQVPSDAGCSKTHLPGQP